MLKRLVLARDFPSAVPARRSFGTSLELAHLAREFPTLEVVVGAGTATFEDPLIRAAQWRALYWEPSRFDRRVLQAIPSSFDQLFVVGELDVGTARAAVEILTRYQLLLFRRNQNSSSTLFTRVLTRQRELFDLAVERERGRYLRGLDTWQWTLRLRPTASFELQVAALFCEARNASPYQWVRGLGLGGVELARIRAFLGEPSVAGDETNGAEGEAEVLRGAMTLSYLSLASADALDRHGAAAFESAVAPHLSRLGPTMLSRLRTIRFRADVERIVVHCLRAQRRERSDSLSAPREHRSFLRGE